MAFTSLNGYLDLEWLREAYRRTRKDGATGVDGRTAEEYAVDLEANLRDLKERAKSGSYRAPPVRRVHIPKGKGRGTRPLGIPTFEDKVLQRAIAMLLEPVYEPLFQDFSYAFRPGRSPHDALRRLREEIKAMEGGWILELDIKSYFDAIPHTELQSIVRKRVRDGVVCRLIGKWLNAGVMEKGRVHRPGSGSPQGGVISPLLSNIYLHEVLDTWFVEEVEPRLDGRAFIVRFADDAVLGFSSKRDAERVLEVLPKRFAKFGLTLHPEKTRLVPFRNPHATGGGDGDGGAPGTLDFLGFTLYWRKTKKGGYTVSQKTAKGRFQRAVTSITEYCRRWRHESLYRQHRGLCQRIRGHIGYFGLPGNTPALRRFVWLAECHWFKWLRRRSEKKHLTWEGFPRLLAKWPLPVGRIPRRSYA